ncbi:MAG TPA: MFS transporter [Nitrososphaerales archaeon]|nr:MFS transporter [Nitrososphaerales archaeon]
MQPNSTTSKASQIISRQDRIPIWALSYLFIGIIGTGFLFTFYDIFNINVSFIQTCLAIISGCNSPADAAKFIGLPVLLNLTGYVVGTTILSPLSDRYGRRNMLLITLVITGLGSLYNAFATDYSSFILARALTGIGVGADLAIVNTYISEVAPKKERVRYTSLVFVFAALGGFLGIWLGLLLTTSPAAFPLGLPFAVGNSGAMPQIGWRVVYAFGTILALIGILLRFNLPESPRWLISIGRVDEAEHIVSVMESKAVTKLHVLPPVTDVTEVASNIRPVPYSEILSNKLYRRRIVVLLLVWLIGYMTIYSVSAGLTSLLTTMSFSPPEAGMIAAFGTIGFVSAAIFSTLFGDRLERKYWLPIAAIITLLGSILISQPRGSFWLAVVGSIILFFGIDLWVPITYAWSAESFPTRARATGFAFVDGIGHIGGGVGVILVAALASSGTFSVLEVFLIIASFQIVSSIIGQVGSRTMGEKLDRISP